MQLMGILRKNPNVYFDKTDISIITQLGFLDTHKILQNRLKQNINHTFEQEQNQLTLSKSESELSEA